MNKLHSISAENLNRVEDLVPYYENVHGCVDFFETTPLTSNYAHGSGLTHIEPGKKITLLNSVRIDTFIQATKSSDLFKNGTDRPEMTNTAGTRLFKGSASR